MGIAAGNLYIGMPVALSGVEAVIGDDEDQIVDAVIRMVPRSKSQRIIRIKIQIEIRPRIGAPEADEAVPGRADLEIDACAEKSHRGCLKGWLHLQVLPDADRGIGTRTRLGTERLVRVHSDPGAGVVGSPSKIHVRAGIAGVEILADGELPGQTCAAGRGGRRRTTRGFQEQDRDQADSNFMRAAVVDAKNAWWRWSREFRSWMLPESRSPARSRGNSAHSR